MKGDVKGCQNWENAAELFLLTSPHDQKTPSMNEGKSVKRKREHPSENGGIGCALR